MNRLPSFLLLVVCLALSSNPVRAAEVSAADVVDNAEIYRSDDADKQVKGLIFDSEPLSVERESHESGDRYQTRLKGRFTRPYQAVKYRIENQETKDLLLQDGRFDLPVVLTSSKLKIQFFAEENERTHLFEAIYIRSALSELNHRFILAMGLSYQYLAFEESGARDYKFQALGVTPSLGATYRLGRRFELNLAGSITAFTTALKNSPDSIASSRFYGLNTRVGFRLWEFSKKARLWVMPGWYFWGQLGPDSDGPNSYGVKSLSGPQIFLTARLLTNAGRNGYVYLKWASIQSGQPSSSENREVSVGMGYQISDPFRAKLWMLTFDVSQAKYNGIKSGNPHALKLTSAGIGMSTNL